VETGRFVRDVAPAGNLPGYPGSSGGSGPQNRLFYDVAARQAHRVVAEQNCAAIWGPYWNQQSGGLTNACAAYPFDDSVQGASATSQFRVRPVLTADHDEFLAENHTGTSSIPCRDAGRAGVRCPGPVAQRGGLPFQAASQVLGPSRPESLMPLARWRARTASRVFS
jgi:hypothetical protein